VPVAGVRVAGARGAQPPAPCPQVYVLKRPHVDEFLQRMGELFECVLFTASLAKVGAGPPLPPRTPSRGVRCLLVPGVRAVPLRGAGWGN